VFRDTIYGLKFGIYNTLINYFNKNIKKLQNACYNVIKCLGFRVSDLKFYKILCGLWFGVYNTLVNSFNKHLKKVRKLSLKCYNILRVQSLGFRV